VHTEMSIFNRAKVPKIKNGGEDGSWRGCWILMLSLSMCVGIIHRNKLKIAWLENGCQP
jgi:hypothetical protein